MTLPEEQKINQTEAVDSVKQDDNDTQILLREIKNKLTSIENRLAKLESDKTDRKKARSVVNEAGKTK